ncbi:MAG TPA: glutaredoxin domain-containing protein [Clostridiaceae bacterium]
MIKVYSTPDCSWCQKTKAYLKLKGFEFEDINVEKDMRGRREYLAIPNVEGVPVINIDGNIIFGFDKKKMDEFLKRK